MKQLNILCEEQAFDAAVEKIICSYDIPGYLSIDALTVFTRGMSEKLPSGTYKLFIVPIKNETARQVFEELKHKSEEICRHHACMIWITPVEKIFLPLFTLPEHEESFSNESEKDSGRDELRGG